MAYRTGPCEWPVDWTCCSCPPPDPPDTPDAIYETAVGWATEILWNLSGRRYGLCEATVRPCGERCARSQGTYRGFSGNNWTLPGHGGRVGPWSPALVDGAWVNCSTDCSSDCCDVCELDLPFGPACDITEIQIDGAIVDPSEYRIDSYRRLVRQGGGDCWPTCQDLSKPLGEGGTWGVTYRWGIPVPAGGQVAAGKLACELVKACNGDDDCQLPQRVTQITRQGVTMTLIDTATDLWKHSATGLFEVDLWLNTVNPYRLKERSSVWSPELGRRKKAANRTTTWTP